MSLVGLSPCRTVLKRRAFVSVGLIQASGGDNSVAIDRPPTQVVRVAESLAPRHDPPPQPASEGIPGQEWTVHVAELVPGQKFEQYGIPFRIVPADLDRTGVTVAACHADPMGKRTDAPRIARKYLSRLVETAMKQECHAHGFAPSHPNKP